MELSPGDILTRAVRVIAKKRLRAYWTVHPDAEGPLSSWFKEAEKATWEKFADLKSQYPSADLIGDRIVFNIGGNNFRLLVYVDYIGHGVLIRWIGTHAEYNKLSREQIEKI